MNAEVMMGLGDLEHELRSTRTMLERVPMERGEWKAHSKSFSVGAAAMHVANLVHWMQVMLVQDHFDLAGGGRSAPMQSSAELLAHFDAGVASLLETLRATDPAAMAEPWTLRSGDHVLFTMPRGAVLRMVGINHLVHHRGQLSVYLRLMDVPVPGMYGPSADDAQG